MANGATIVAPLAQALLSIVSASTTVLAGGLSAKIILLAVAQSAVDQATAC